MDLAGDEDTRATMTEAFLVAPVGTVGRVGGCGIILITDLHVMEAPSITIPPLSIAK